MTLYYTLVFLLLVAEMGLFMLLIVPLPFTLRRKMFTYGPSLQPHQAEDLPSLCISNR